MGCCLGGCAQSTWTQRQQLAAEGSPASVAPPVSEPAAFEDPALTTAFDRLASERAAMQRTVGLRSGSAGAAVASGTPNAVMAAQEKSGWSSPQQIGLSWEQ